ncbi:MAG: hypothetical protein QOJ11_2302 [Frankiales bacterium]|nr:hypothetical protein [Frankiales bacterium]
MVSADIGSLMLDSSIEDGETGESGTARDARPPFANTVRIDRPSGLGVMSLDRVDSAVACELAATSAISDANRAAFPADTRPSAAHKCRLRLETPMAAAISPSDKPDCSRKREIAAAMYDRDSVVVEGIGPSRFAVVPTCTNRCWIACASAGVTAPMVPMIVALMSRGATKARDEPSLWVWDCVAGRYRSASSPKPQFGAVAIPAFTIGHQTRATRRPSGRSASLRTERRSRRAARTFVLAA